MTHGASQPVSQVAVVGAGPAGITCAVQLVRMGIQVLLLEPGEPGGIIRMAWRVENWPAFPNGTAGRVIAERLAAHLGDFNLVPVRVRVHRIVAGAAGEPFALHGEPGRFDAEAVVLACGLQAKELDVPEAVRPYLWTDPELPPDPTGKVLVVGAGDVAYDQAARWRLAGASVTLARRRERLRALPRIVERVRGLDIAEHISRRPVWRVDEAGVWRDDLPDPGPYRFIVPHIGRVPQPPVVVDDNGRVPLARDGFGGETVCPNLFVVGDQCRGRYRQGSIAMGDGMQAALTLAERFGVEV